MTLDKIVQQWVNHHALERWNDDETPPQFVVSTLSSYLILTVIHNGDSISEYLFPHDCETPCASSELEETMEHLYNKTM